MLALDEKPRTVVLLRAQLEAEQPDTLSEVLFKFQDRYLDVKAHKQVLLQRSAADRFFHYLPNPERQAIVDSYCRGLSSVLVLENLDGDVVEKTCELAEALNASYGPDFMYCSQGAWEAARDLDFFFPHLEQLPVERTLAIIKPDGLMQSGRVDNLTLEESVEARVANAGLLIVGKRRQVLDEREAGVLCKDLVGTPEHKQAIAVLCAEHGAIVMCLEGPGAVGKWRLICGPTSCSIARERAPDTLRAKWGTDSTSNAVHASESMEAAEKELRLFFPRGTWQLQRTLCIVKPDAMPNLLQIRQAIDEAGFTVLAEKQTRLSEERAAEFYRDLKEKPFFSSLVRHASSGPCHLLVLCRLEAVAVWQQLMGPESVKDARAFRPRSLRARFGRDGQRNAVHGSSSQRSAQREVRFFFPELGVDPAPSDDEVRDFILRKSAGASMDLKSLSDADNMNLNNVDPTLQQLLSKGLMALCQVQPKGLTAVKWLSRWLTENNPNTKLSEEKMAFMPPDRTKRFIEHGVNQDGLAFAVEPPVPAKKKQVIEVDVAQEAEEQRTSDLASPPFVVFVVGGPGSGKGTQCARLREEFNLVHLSTGDLMREEVAAETYLGTEIYKHMQQGSLVPDAVTLQLLKKTMVKHEHTNRFLLDGFPRSVEQALRFEQEVAEIAFGVYFEASPDTMRQRIAGRAAKAPGRPDDTNPETISKRIEVFEQTTMPVVDYYQPIGKIRIVNAESDPEEVYQAARQYFSCRFLYLLGPPGAPLANIAGRLEEQYGYSAIDFDAQLKSGGDDKEIAAKVKLAMEKGRPLEASVACPLVLSQIQRDMRLGVQNYVICGFPQSAKQAQFLEHCVSATPKTLLLDFERADAEDLACFSSAGGDAVEVEMKINSLFGDERKEMLKALGTGLVRMPCGLAGLESTEHLAEAVWSKVREKTMPGLTIVLGLPCSGTENLADLLAGLTPNTVAVDCDQLLDKELERRTEIGIGMHNMLARGQTVPFSVTLELLKNTANLTCSDSLVVQNCPMYADQIEYITREFRVERVFYISGNEQAVESWRAAYLEKGQGEEPPREAKAFNEHIERLEPVVRYFSKLGKLEQLDVLETPKPQKLAKMVEQATMPQVVTVHGVSAKLTEVQANLLATAYGVGPALNMEALVRWTETTLKRAVDPGQAEEVLSALKQYADAQHIPLLVLDRYPANANDASAFLEYFGKPKVAVHVFVDEEFRTEEYREETAEDDNPPDDEELAKLLEAERAEQEGTFKVFEEKCLARTMTLNWMELKDIKSPEEVNVQVRSRLLPQVYVLLAPSAGDFAGLAANAICTARREGQRMKFTVIDALELVSGVGASVALKDKLRKAGCTAETPDCLPPPLWVELFKEALANAADPMGSSFLVTNFPTPSALTASPTVRDQLSILESISIFAGVVDVRLSEAAFQTCCGLGEAPAEEGAAAHAAYADFESRVSAQIAVQYGASHMCSCSMEEAPKSAVQAAQTVATDFFTHVESTERPPE